MSMHEIEGLVEDSLRRVLASGRSEADKRRLAGRLYRFQAWFDTGDTTGRLRDELAAIGFDPAARQDDPPLLHLALEMMQEAEAAGDLGGVHDWLALAVTALDELELGDLVPRSLAQMLAEGSALKMREIAVRCAVFRPRIGPSGIRLPGWNALRDSHPALQAERLEKRHMLRLLTDPKTDVARITADHAAEADRIARLADAPLFTLGDRVPQRTDLVYLGMTRSRGGHDFVFATSATPPGPDTARLFLVISHDADIGILVPEARVQLGQILRWQGAESFDRVEDTHFRMPFHRLIPPEVLEADKNYHMFGGWKMRIDQSAKVLDARLATILAHWADVQAKLAHHLTVPLPQLLSRHAPAAMEKKRKALRDSTGFFTNDIEVLFAYACLSWDRGQRPDALIVQIEDGLDAVHEDYPLKVAWTEAARRLRDGPAFPPLTMWLPYRNLKKT